MARILNSEAIQEVVTNNGVEFRATKILNHAHALANFLEANYGPFLKAKSLVPAEVEIWIPEDIPYIRMDWVGLGRLSSAQDVLLPSILLPVTS